jgi:hypothetical protein
MLGKKPRLGVPFLGLTNGDDNGSTSSQARMKTLAMAVVFSMNAAFLDCRLAHRRVASDMLRVPIHMRRNHAAVQQLWV